MSARTQAVAFALFGLTVALWAGPAILTLTGAAEQPSDAPAQPAPAAQEHEASLSPEEQIAKEGVIPALAKLRAEMEEQRKGLAQLRGEMSDEQRKGLAQLRGEMSNAIQFKELPDLGGDPNRPYDTGYSAKEWQVGIVGFKTTGGDINEYFNHSPPILAWPTVGANGNWHVVVDFKSHGHGENWTVKLIAIRRGILTQ